MMRGNTFTLAVQRLLIMWQWYMAQWTLFCVGVYFTCGAKFILMMGQWFVAEWIARIVLGALMLWDLRMWLCSVLDHHYCIWNLFYYI